MSQATAVTGTGRLYLTKGIITSSISNIILIGSTASVTLASTASSNPSFVDGPIQKTGLAAFTFPVGKTGTGYVPIAIGAITGTGTPQTFTAEYIHTSAQSLGPIGPSTPQLVHVSGCDYWRLDLGANYSASISNNALPTGATTNVTLFWNANNGKNCAGTYVTNLSTLAIGHLDVASGQSYTGLWTPIGVGGYSFADPSSTTDNSITYVGASNFSPFTLATTDGTDNPLPIKLDYFDAVKSNGYNKLTWKAECTSSSSGFEVQRSGDGIHFTGIYDVAVGSPADCSAPFEYDDHTGTGSKAYYRIKMADIDGDSTYSDIRLILNGGNTIELMSMRPNPLQGEGWLEVSASQSSKIELVVLTIDGREMLRKTFGLQAGSNTINMQTGGLAKGVYIVRGIFSGGQTNVIPFVKQ